MSSDTRKLNTNDLVVRFDPSTKTVMFLPVLAGSGVPSSHSIHDVTLDSPCNLEGVVDVGAAVCAHLYSHYPGDFCSDQEWDQLANSIRDATGRND
jgi:hypothetical protein